MFRWLGLLVAGAISAMGLGGGGLVMLVLQLSGLGQREAQGVNLLLLVPVGMVGLWMHWKNGYLRRELLGRMLVGGSLGAAAGLILAGKMPERWLKGIFGVLLLGMAVREFLAGIRAGKEEKWRLFPEKNGE